MRTISLETRHLRTIAISLTVLIGLPAFAGEPKSSKEIIQKRKAEAEKSPPASGPPKIRIPSSRVIIPKRQLRKHIRFALPTDDRNEIDFHTVLTKSTRSLGFSVEYFDDSRRREIEATITCFRDNRRDEGYDHWNRFVASLETFEKPVDLEPVMYYVLREGCLRQDPNVLFHAERLERAQGDLGTIAEYWDDLYRLNRQCKEPGNQCLDTVERKIEDELEILGQERDLARAKVGVAQRALERAQMTASGEVTRSVDAFYTVAQEIARRTEVVLYADSD
jgi:hypothetical protein